MFNNHLYPIANELQDNNQIKTDGSVAIIMRTKNRTILLARAINSVIEQSYHNWHLYIVNDGGEPKDVEDLVDIYSNDLNQRITIIHNPDSLGMEAASNCAFQIAHEEFLVIHDDDDSWHPEFLQETVQFLQQDKSAVAVICNCQVIHEEIIHDTVKELAIFDWDYWKDFVDIDTLIKGNIAPPICLLIRMKAAKTIGGFNESLPVLGDWDYNLRLFRLGEIRTLNKKLAYYHHRPNANGTYGNSVIAGVDKHLKYQTEYRNAMVRQALMDNQANFGLLHTLLHDIEKSKNELIWHIHNTTSRNQRDEEMYQMVYYFYKKINPISVFFRNIKEKIRTSRKKFSKTRAAAHWVRDRIRKLRNERSVNLLNPPKS
ncbi:glycosyltransferase family A protein [Moraxella cuniculi]|uniref:PGL/p-HBAD biosynthesis glycosyltransferase Rv2957/MT3031 n=1 Tax=Moraxella cuniculi TaxID=34061 RepID=A0A3S4SCS7_9GAMM|nr:glycosyltransferase family 2 protein [Moraxella cuniculi]VEG13275.1 PGL/p-HBAD biosynthesis glycosyltransferase Rv2957/MT3031 [Moraxella cuniculi]